jgi:hypothetical protein
LLELGLWNPLDKLVEVEDEDFERVKRGFQSMTMQLDGYVSCISINTPIFSPALGELGHFICK